MTTVLYIILTGILSRADGWGDSSWPRVEKFFNAQTCSILFAILTTFYASPLVALAAGLAFWLFRAAGFDSWTDWFIVFWRGFWPTFIGFTLLSLVAHGIPYWGMLSVPFTALYALIYVGGYKWAPETILGFNRHVWIEHASGWLFGATVMLVV
jgi:hypothetical protein